jgi:hypothetical protein
VAQKVQVLLSDDIDGSEATQTVKFGWLGAEYEIDLNDKNYASFEKAVSKYLAVARRTGGRVRGKRSAPAVDMATVRAWAREQGYEVSDRGRVSGEVLEAYTAAH